MPVITESSAAAVAARDASTTGTPTYWNRAKTQRYDSANDVGAELFFDGAAFRPNGGSTTQTEQDTKIAEKAGIDLGTPFADDAAFQAAFTEDAIGIVAGVPKLYDAATDTVQELSTSKDVWPATTDGMTLPDEQGLQYVLVSGHTINLPDFTQTENFDIELAPSESWETMTYTINQAVGWKIAGTVLAGGTETVRLFVDVAAKEITAAAGGSTPAEFAEYALLSERPDPATTTLKLVYIAETPGLFVRRVVATVPVWEQV